MVVAAVVLGPGSILTSSKVGAGFGGIGVPVVIAAAVMMIGMVALAARIGVSYQHSTCDEISERLGRPVAVVVGLILFLVVALFQSSNNLAMVAGLAPLVEMANGGKPVGTTAQILLLLAFNGVLIAVLYLMRELYQSVEKLMKFLIGVMVVAFLVNFLFAYLTPRTFEFVAPIVHLDKGDLFALLGMIGTTFSVGGAFYQSYLVKEKGWGISDAKRGLLDTVVSISVLGGVTVMILLTSMRVFFGNPNQPELLSVDQVARQLEPLFGSWASVIFSLGILAAAFSSFLVNAMIGGTVMSDAIRKGSRLSDGWPIHLTGVALLTGMGVAMLSLTQSGSHVTLITIAQALTVVGNPALAAALIYLGTRPEMTGSRRIPRWILTLAWIGFFVSCFVAVRTGMAVWAKIG
ncbi:MAG: divalent metal cation transporter [Verrucomicrobiaceae bacterium]|nr:divalent metal cation transporter [Verrucomicrobiaceae bacterium]